MGRSWCCQLFGLQLLLVFSQSCAKLCSHDQSSALLQFKNLFSLQKLAHFNCNNEQFSYPKMNTWKEETDCCTWEGITCDRSTGEVIGVDLRCGWLYGNLASNNSMSSLLHLRSLDLAFNNFNFSRISSGFFQFPRLKFLRLTDSNLIGPIPSSLDNLTKLIHLDLSGNGFSSLPPSLSNLKQLRHLILCDNNFIGGIPNVLANLSQLSELDMSRNQLTGPIPDIFANLSQLSVLSLEYNQLIGGIPRCLSGLRNLGSIDLSNNFLQGVIPSWLFTLPSLQIIHLDDNQLTGPILLSLFELENLTALYLGSNKISDEVELSMFTKLKNLRELDLSDISLSLTNTVKGNSSFSNLELLKLSRYNISEFPIILKPLHRLLGLDLSENKIHGEIPSWMLDKRKHSLIGLNLSYNFLTGTIEHILWSRLYHLDLQSNYLQGSLIVPPPQLSIFSVSNNKLTGEIPSSFGNLSLLVYLDLSKNNLSGMIPGNLATSPWLIVLDLQQSNFHGGIPLTFANDSTLAVLNLNGNQLEGPLPPSLVNCSSLRVLDVGNNKISGTFPHWLATLSELKVVILRSNRFHGPIGSPNTRNHFTHLRILDLSHNGFSGVLPTVYFKSFEAMIHGHTASVRQVEYIEKYLVNVYYSAFLTVKGNDIEMSKIQTSFSIIDLSSNKFQGGIPEAVGKFNSLMVLNFSHNSLTGPIPTWLGNLKALESLDLSSNKLVGEIPWQLTSLNFLQVLNLSYNQLEGPIPRENHFDTLTNDSYIGNAGLCGFPLSKECGTDKPPQSSSTTEDDSESENGFSWKSVFTGYGCGTVFGVLMGYVAISTGKPRWLAKIAEGVYGIRVGRKNNKRRRGRIAHATH